VTRSIYILGGAGTGKSTFMAQLMDEAILGYETALTDFCTVKNARGNPVTLRGHYVDTYDGVRGVYLGYMRDSFPGTDGLDRASSIAGEAWLQGDLPEFIIAEGNTLATSRFLTALSEATEMLLVHLTCEDWIRELRFIERGSEQNAGWVKNSDPRCRNLFNRFGGLEVDSADPTAWKLALAGCLAHLRGTD